MTIVGVSIGLGHVWRFPYMVGKFGGAAFVLFYTLVSIVIGVPALMTEFALGRHTRRGPVGAFERAGLPLGKYVGWFLFFVVTAATGYYSAVIGWVLYYAIGQLAVVAHVPFDAGAILPPRARLRGAIVRAATRLHGGRAARVRGGVAARRAEGHRAGEHHRAPAR